MAQRLFHVIIEFQHLYPIAMSAFEALPDMCSAIVHVR
jgi:hypothetical protein